MQLKATAGWTIVSKKKAVFSGLCCQRWEFLFDPPALELAAYLPLMTFTSGEIAYLLV